MCAASSYVTSVLNPLFHLFHCMYNMHNTSLTCACNHANGVSEMSVYTFELEVFSKNVPVLYYGIIVEKSAPV